MPLVDLSSIDKKAIKLKYGNKEYTVAHGKEAPDEEFAEKFPEFIMHNEVIEPTETEQIADEVIKEISKVDEEISNKPVTPVSPVKPSNLEVTKPSKSKEPTTFMKASSWIFEGWKHIMGVKFITLVAMVLIAVSAISFDVDGWKETYHRLGDKVIFMIAALYIAKIAIIKILSVKNNLERFNSYKDKIVSSINNFLLKSVLIASLASMVFVSFVGIYASLAVNTLGDVNTMKLQDKGLERLYEKKSNIAKQITLYQNEVENLSDRFVTLRSKKMAEIRRLYDVKMKVDIEIEEKLASVEKHKSEESNKAINYTAELLNMNTVELLKLINILMVLTLELTYLALTWYVVRLT